LQAVFFLSKRLIVNTIFYTKRRNTMAISATNTTAEGLVVPATLPLVIPSDKPPTTPTQTSVQAVAANALLPTGDEHATPTLSDKKIEAVPSDEQLVEYFEKLSTSEAPSEETPSTIEEPSDTVEEELSSEGVKDELKVGVSEEESNAVPKKRSFLRTTFCIASVAVPLIVLTGLAAVYTSHYHPEVIPLVKTSVSAYGTNMIESVRTTVTPYVQSARTIVTPYVQSYVTPCVAKVQSWF
jgi:hypothetical protein